MSDGPAPEVHLVVPTGIDDPARPSGGNRYDRRLVDELAALGRRVREHRAGDDLGAVLRGLPDGATVLVDGLLGCRAPEAVVPASARLRVVVLLHMPFAEAATDDRVRRAERAVLTAAAGVVTTSDWARGWVVRHHGLDPDRVWTATPGVDPPPRHPPGPGPGTGGRLLCLAAVTRGKGHDTLLAALAEVADLAWTCTCAGALDLEPDYVAGLRELALRSGIGGRVRFPGPLTGPRLAHALASTDLLVSASRHESYGMAVAEALSYGVPVVVTDVGGHREPLGRGLVPIRTDRGPEPADWDQSAPLPTDPAPGRLVPPDDPDRLAAALRAWLTDPDERRRLRAAAAARGPRLDGWAATARRVAAALDAVRLNPDGSASVSPTTPAAG